MQPEQPTQGATRTHCTRPGSRSHMMAIRMLGGALVSVRQCELCGWIDFDDLNAQVSQHAQGLSRTAREEGIVEGLERAAAAIEAVSEIDGEFYRRVIFGEDPTKPGGSDA